MLDAARLQLHHRAGAGRIRRPFPDREIAESGERRGAWLGIEQAEKEGADLVVATDPDCDRMGVAVRDAQRRDGACSPATRSARSWRATARKTLFEQGILNKENASRGVIIKTFVTTDLQKAIAEHYGLRCVETLTGFKYIGAKLGKYERALPAETRGELPHAARRGDARACAWSIPPSTSSAARKATATAARISCATRMATAPRSCFAKWRPTRNRAG